ncbi:MAG TPA: hypothetical protein VFP72_08950 [Kineosporiaceae bacterium]|nr:hypothetical protein [Kineosporiaceae bacterium]
MARLGWRRRGGHEPDGPQEPDPVYGYLTAAQGARLRSLVRQSFAERGVEVTLLPDRVETAGGGQYGLTNLAATCNASPAREWPSIVAWHVETVLRALSAPPVSELDDATVLAHVFVRVMGLSAVPDLSALDYRRELGGDLVELLALDSEHSVSLLLDGHVERFGVDTLRHAGLVNLLAEPFGSCDQVEVGDGGSFHCLLGDSVYTASRLLTLDDVLRRCTGEADAPHGVLACVPNRHQLAFHVLTDATVLTVLPAMARFALAGFTDGVGPVSPYLYWHRRGTLTQLSRTDSGGDLRIEVGDEFAEVLQRLAGKRPRE